MGTVDDGDQLVRWRIVTDWDGKTDNCCNNCCSGEDCHRTGQLGEIMRIYCTAGD